LQQEAAEWLSRDGVWIRDHRRPVLFDGGRYAPGRLGFQNRSYMAQKVKDRALSASCWAMSSATSRSPTATHWSIMALQFSQSRTVWDGPSWASQSGHRTHGAGMFVCWLIPRGELKSLGRQKSRVLSEERRMTAKKEV